MCLNSKVDCTVLVRYIPFNPLEFQGLSLSSRYCGGTTEEEKEFGFLTKRTLLKVTREVFCLHLFFQGSRNREEEGEEQKTRNGICSALKMQQTVSVRNPPPLPTILWMETAKTLGRE